MNKINEISYAGIGSRKTPDEVLQIFIYLGKVLAEKGFILRSGHAEGSDQAFETGCDLVNGKKEIYLPWKGFNNSDSKLFWISNEAMDLAKKYHPVFDRQTVGVKKLLARDGYQVLGYRLNDPTNMVICYTEFGKNKGGTSQAIRIANDYNIPVFNAGTYSNLDLFVDDVLRYAKNISFV